jgi:hypothetical protein
MAGLIKATYVYIVSMCMGSVLTSGREGQYGQKKTSQWFFGQIQQNRGAQSKQFFSCQIVAVRFM